MSQIFSSELSSRIENLLDNPDNDAMREWFDSFHAELQDSINPSVIRNDAIDMMAQHLLTPSCL